MWICWGYQKVGEAFILDFPTYLDKCINEGLIALKQGKQVPFRWYSLLMHLIIFQCQDYFGHVFDLEIEKDGEKLLVQLWTTILSSDWNGENLCLFENDFAYMLRRKLIPQVDNFPFLLKCFMRPIDFDVKPTKCHNWGDIYFYNNTTIIRIYGFPEDLLCFLDMYH